MIESSTSLLAHIKELKTACENVELMITPLIGDITPWCGDKESIEWLGRAIIKSDEIKNRFGPSISKWGSHPIPWEDTSLTDEP